MQNAPVKRSVYFFINCRFLKHFNIIENDNFEIYGKQIYERKPHFAQAFYLPYNIQYINGKKVFPLTSMSRLCEHLFLFFPFGFQL